MLPGSCAIIATPGETSGLGTHTAVCDNPAGTYTADGLCDKIETLRDSCQTFTLVCPDHSGGITVKIIDADVGQDATRGISRGRSTRLYMIQVIETS